MDTEKRIQLAIKDLKQKKYPTVTVAARVYGVQQSTLYRCYHHQTSDCTHAQESQMNLASSQERAVIKWIQSLTAKGFPPTYPLLWAWIESVQCAEDPAAPPLGKNYITKFITCHPNLGASFSERHDKERVFVGVQAVYQDFFHKVRLSNLWLMRLGQLL